MLTDEELLRRLGEELDVRDEEVLEEAFRILKDDFDKDVDHARSYPEEGVLDLVADLEETHAWPFIRREAKRAKARRRDVREVVVSIELQDYEREYPRALSSYLAGRAGGLPEVRRFREDELGGRCLTEEEALERLRREELELRGLSDLESWNDFEREVAGEVWGMSELELLRDRGNPALAAGLGSYDEHLFPSGLELGVFDWPAGFGWSKRDEERVGWKAGGGQPGWRDPRDAERCPSVDELGRWLAGLYPWRPTDAVWFVLTGKPPEAVAAELSYDHQRNLLTLVFSPWVSERTVRRAYQRARWHLELGENRGLTDKALAVMNFVAEESEKRGSRSTWEGLRRLWNRLHVDDEAWRYESVQGLRQACLRAEASLGIRKKPVGKKEPPVVLDLDDL
jgi:hypothetical protein